MARADTFADLADFARAGSLGAGRRPRVDVFRAPRRVLMGDEITLSWRTSAARRVELAIHGGAELRRDVAHAGQWTLREPAPGLLQAELRLWGDDDQDQAAPSRVETIEIDVAAPPVRLRLQRRELSAPPGAVVRLRWTAEGAARVVITRALVAEVLEAPAIGAVDLVMDAVADEVELAAIGHDGASRQIQKCQLRPEIDHGMDVSVELASLTQNLEELQ